VLKVQLTVTEVLMPVVTTWSQFPERSAGAGTENWELETGD
jgi:hypothetical protein